MSRKNRKKKQVNNQNQSGKKEIKLSRPGTVAFEKPEIVYTGAQYYFQNTRWREGDCYDTPVDRLSLAQLPNMNPQHGGIVQSRRNMLLSTYQMGGLTNTQAMGLFSDLILFGDCYLLKIRNMFDEVIDLMPLMSLYVRAKKNLEETEITGFVLPQKNERIEYDVNDVIQIKIPDPLQQVYGLPDYLGGVNSAMLNSESTMFRRRYYNNGAHMGYIFYTNDPNMTNEMEAEIKEKIENSKGVGNFKNMFVSIPNGEENAIKLIPVGDLNSAKDEFSNVKNISAQDLLNAHRFPAGLCGVIPENGSSNGDVTKLRRDYMSTETKVLQDLIENAVNTDKELISSPFSSKLLFVFNKINENSDNI